MAVHYRCGGCGQGVVFTPSLGETDNHTCPPTAIEVVARKLWAKMTHMARKTLRWPR